MRKDDLAISLEEEVEKLPRHFSDSAFKHKVSFEGNWISILIRSIFASIVIVLFLELTKTYLNDFISGIYFLWNFSEIVLVLLSHS